MRYLNFLTILICFLRALNAAEKSGSLIVGQHSKLSYGGCDPWLDENKILSLDSSNDAHNVVYIGKPMNELVDLHHTGVLLRFKEAPSWWLVHLTLDANSIIIECLPVDEHLVIIQDYKVYSFASARSEITSEITSATLLLFINQIIDDNFWPTKTRSEGGLATSAKAFYRLGKYDCQEFARLFFERVTGKTVNRIETIRSVIEYFFHIRGSAAICPAPTIGYRGSFDSECDISALKKITAPKEVTVHYVEWRDANKFKSQSGVLVSPINHDSQISEQLFYLASPYHKPDGTFVHPTLFCEITSPPFRRYKHSYPPIIITEYIPSSIESLILNIYRNNFEAELSEDGDTALYRAGSRSDSQGFAKALYHGMPNNIRFPEGPVLESENCAQEITVETMEAILRPANKRV